jgi:stage IV sporulation protein FB
MAVSSIESEAACGIVLSFLLEINLFWPILNLFPVWPLDGGQMCREVCVAASPRSGAVAAMIISACVAGLLALHCLFPKFLGRHVPFLRYFGGIYLAIFFAYLCAQSIMALSALNAARQRRYSDDEFPWER